VCDLGSLVLSKFVSPNGQTQRARLREVIRLAVRFLDDVIDINNYVLHEIDVNAHAGRRVGLGVMGLAEYLFAKGVRYGSEKAIEETESIMKLIRNTAYETSIELAVEKGAFPKFDPVQYGKAHFIRTLPAKMRMNIKDKGIRNVTCMAMAPTGTISLIPEVSSGIEPLFGKAYVRHDRVGDRVYIHPTYIDHVKVGEALPDWFVDINDITPSDHFEIQSVVQKYTDGAVSKTINMPTGTTSDELSKFTLEYIRDLKGVTVYVDGSREGQIVSHLSKKDAVKYIRSGQIETVDEEAIKCKSGVCEI
jgi:ribonucleoside-diphosphate reductase alpha chain